MSKSKRSLLVLCIAMSALTMTGCANLAELLSLEKKESVVPALEANLKKECAPLHPPKSGKGSDLLAWNNEVIFLYYVCVDKHRRVTQAYENVRKELAK